MIPTRAWLGRRKPRGPHAHGDHGLWGTSGLEHLKSSPHAWGPHLDLGFTVPLVGIIPTRVGTTTRAGPYIGAGRDHPHTRGDHYPNMAPSTCFPGSSPHAWGPQEPEDGDSVVMGIIPTRVGTTRPHRLAFPNVRDHPHTRGDHWGRGRASSASKGSSPHAWGPLGMTAKAVLKNGIIPTRVGTTGR